MINSLISSNTIQFNTVFLRQQWRQRSSLFSKRTRQQTSPRSARDATLLYTETHPLAEPRDSSYPSQKGTTQLKTSSYAPRHQRTLVTETWSGTRQAVYPDDSVGRSHDEALGVRSHTPRKARDSNPGNTSVRWRLQPVIPSSFRYSDVPTANEETVFWLSHPEGPRIPRHGKKLFLLLLSTRGSSSSSAIFKKSLSQISTILKTLHIYFWTHQHIKQPPTTICLWKNLSPTRF